MLYVPNFHSFYGYTTADGVTYSCDAYNATSRDYIRFDVDMSADSIGDLRDDDGGGYQTAADFWTAIDELCVFPAENSDSDGATNSGRWILLLILNFIPYLHIVSTDCVT